MPAGSQDRSWLPIIFWGVFCASELIFIVPALEEMAHPGGQFSGLAVIMLLAIAAVLAVVAAVVALFRKPLGYAIGVSLMAVPLLWWTVASLSAFGQRLAAPSLEDQVGGRGYFSAPADRALAEAIVARDAARVAELAPKADLGATGWGDMSFMRLAMDSAHADPDILGPLLRAGLDPDQAASVMYSHISSSRDEVLLRRVIESGVDLGKHMGRGDWFLFARYDWPEGLTLMLDHGVNLEARDSIGYTMIMRAAQAGSWRTVETLLARGARTDQVGNDGQSLRDLLSGAMARPSGPDGPAPPAIVAFQASLAGR